VQAQRSRLVPARADGARPVGAWGGLAGSFRAAWNGVVETALHQRNMRIHLVAALLVALLGTAVPFGPAERLALLLAVFLVLAAEVANTALEALVDLVTRETHVLARSAKDASAGAVLLLALAAVAVLGVVLRSAWDVLSVSGTALWRQASPGLPLAGVVAALLVPLRRDRAIDVALAGAGLFLLGLVAWGSVSAVFSALAALVLAIACATAYRRRSPGPRGPGGAVLDEPPPPGEASGPLHKATRSREDHGSFALRRGSTTHDG
jgi:diacylglycerol kinase (ATP)